MECKHGWSFVEEREVLLIGFKRQTELVRDIYIISIRNEDIYITEIDDSDTNKFCFNYALQREKSRPT